MRSPWSLYSHLSICLGMTRGLKDALMMEWQGFSGHSKDDFSLTTSNCSLYFFFFLSERIGSTIYLAWSWPLRIIKSLVGGGSVRNSPFPRKRDVCKGSSLPLLFFQLPSFDVSMMAWVQQSSCGHETTKTVAKDPTWKGKDKRGPGLG